jgi:hypothetical protein
MVTKTWHVLQKYGVKYSRNITKLVGCYLKKINMARFTKIWREVLKKYYKACRLLFKENIPLGRP